MKRSLAGALALMIFGGGAALAQGAVPAEPSAPTLSDAYLNVVLDPMHLRLSASSRLIVTGTSGAPVLSLRLYPTFKVSSVQLNGQPVAFYRAAHTLTIELPLAQKAPFTLLIAYAGPPETASTEAIYLPPDGEWYPRLLKAPTHTTLRVQIPPHWRALSPAATQDQDGQIGHMIFRPNQAPAVATGIYFSQTAAGVTCWSLDDRKAQGTRGVNLKEDVSLLAFYRSHGLLSALQGGQLVELSTYGALSQGPGWVACQRPRGDIGYWLASAPWASSGKLDPNLVDSLIDYMEMLAQGQKAGLTSNGRSLKAYEECLKDYPQDDQPFPRDFKPAPKTVLLKGALMWAELHQRLGDAAFFGLLKRLQATLVSSKVVGWDNVRALLPDETDWLESWLQETGLPAFGFQDVSVKGEPGAFQVNGVLKQTGPMLAGALSLSLVGLESSQHVTFERFSDAMPFHFVCSDRPVRLLIDLPKDAPVRQRAHLTLREGLSAPNELIVYGTQGDADETRANQQTALALQEQLHGALDGLIPIKTDTQLSEKERSQSLILIGDPASNSIAQGVESQLPVRFMQDKSLWWQGRTYNEPDQGVAEIIANPLQPENTIVLFTGAKPELLNPALRFLKTTCTFCIYDKSGILQKGLALRPFPDLSYPLY